MVRSTASKTKNEVFVIYINIFEIVSYFLPILSPSFKEQLEIQAKKWMRKNYSKLVNFHSKKSAYRLLKRMNRGKKFKINVRQN